MYDNLQDAIDNMVKIKDRFEPIPENVAKYEELYKIFNDAYDALKVKVFPEISTYQGY